MAKNEKMNEEAALNNNLDALTLKTSDKLKASPSKRSIKDRSNKK